MDPEVRQEMAELLRDRVLHPSEVAEMLSEEPPAEAAEFLAGLDEGLAADVVEHLDTAVRRELAELMPRGHMAKVIERMAPDERADFVKELPLETAESILPLIARAERLDIARLASYEEGTVGSVMTTAYTMAGADRTVAEAIEDLRRQAAGDDVGDNVYVVDADRRLLGYVTLRGLLLARPQAPVGRIMRSDATTVRATEDRERLADIFSRYLLTTVPVVDDEGRLLGRVTADDVIDIAEEEAGEDVYRFGAAGEPIDYLRSGVLRVARQRITWLLILVVLGLLSSLLLQSYEGEIQAAVVLVFFLPMLSGSAGNAGSQTTATIIRGLSMGEIGGRDALRVVLRELRIGLIVGAALGAFALGRALLVPASDAASPWRLGITVGLAMVGAVTLAKTLGGLLPIVFKRLKLDPALMSTPFITSIVDVFTIVVYFRLANVVYLAG